MTLRLHKGCIAAISCSWALLAGCGGDGNAEEPRALPTVTGVTLTQAEQRLERANVSWVLSAEEGPGTRTFETARESSGSTNRALATRRVVGQDPKPGSKVTSGDVILLMLRR